MFQLSGLLNFKGMAIACAASLLIGAAGGGWLMHRLDALAKIEAVNTARDEERKACADNQKVTEDTDHELQGKLTDLQRRHAAALRRLRESCVPAVTVTTGGANGTAGGNGLPAANRIDARDLVDLAAAADRNTEQLISCQNFLRRERELR